MIRVVVRRGLLGLAILSLLPVFAMLTACESVDARLAGLPREERTIYLENFSNSTFEADVHVEWVEALRQRLDQRRGYLPVAEPAEARFVLSGEVVVFRRDGYMYDNENAPLRYDLMMVVRLRLTDRQSGNIVTSFEEDARTQYSVREGLAEDEFTARQRLYRSLTRKAYARLSEAFPAK